MDTDGVEPLSTALGQILQRAKVPEDLPGWLKKVQIIDPDSFALMACTEDEIEAQIVKPYLAERAKEVSMAEKVAITKAWTKCRRQMDLDNKTGGCKANNENLPDDIAAELRTTWEPRHQLVLSSCYLLRENLQGLLHRELTASPPSLTVLPIAQLRPVDSVNHNSEKHVLVRDSADGTVSSKEVVDDVVHDHFDFCRRARCLFYTIA